MLSFLESQQVQFGSIIIMPERIHRQDNEHNEEKKGGWNIQGTRCRCLCVRRQARYCD